MEQEYTIFNDGPRRWIQRTSDGAMIPLDQMNSDFQDFLKWNAQQESPINCEIVLGE